MKKMKGFSRVLMALVLSIFIFGAAGTCLAKNWKSGHPFDTETTS